jgi:outer membrane receptor protein involved in Fe transport
VTTYTYGNVGEGFTRGAELEAGAARGGLRADASYAYLQARGDDGAALLGRAAHAARLALSFARASGLRAALTGSYTGAAPVSRDEAGVTTERDAWLRWDARVAQRLPGGLEAAAGVDNLFGARPDGWPGYAGRHLYLTLGWTLGDARRAPAASAPTHTDGPDR